MYTFRILKVYREIGITKRDLVEKSTKPHSLEHCIKVYGVYSDNNKDRKNRYVLELDDLEQPADKRAEQKGFYQAKNKIIARPARPKMKLGSQNHPELLYCHHCPICKRTTPKHSQQHERGFSKKGLMMHLARCHDDKDEAQLQVYIQALPVRI